MSRSKKKQTVGYRYYVGVHMGICEGPVDALLELRSEDRTAWLGEVTASGQITVNAPTLFGGEEREGGLQGTVDVMMGEAAQGTNAYLTALQGTPQSAYRGILGLVFRAFYWGNSPYLKPIATLAKRITSGWSTGTAWYPEKAPIVIGTTAAGPWANNVGDPRNSVGIYEYRYVYARRNLTAPSTVWRATLAEAIADGVALNGYPSGVSLSGAPWADSFTNLIGWSADRISLSRAYSSAPADQSSLYLHFNREVPGHPIQAYRTTMTGSASASTIGGAFDAYPVVVSEPGFWWTGLDPLGNGIDAGLDNGAGVYQLTPGPTVPTGFYFLNNLTSYPPDGGGFFPVASFSQDQVIEVRRVGSDIVAMNPAHMIYQCLTDTSFGMGYSTSSINAANFAEAADLFFEEGLGLCMHWTQQEPIEAFIQRIVDHAGAALVQNPSTGLFEIVPLRGGYDVGSLPVFDETCIESVLSYQKPAPAEATNEITVRYTDVAAGPGKVASVRVQNLANITAQGGVVSKTQQYPGLVSATTALRVAMRDLKAVSSPQAKVRLRVQRKGYTLTRGGLFVWNWPKLSISGMVLRVLRINYGSLTDSTIEIEAAEDVYSMPEATYGAEQPSGWVAPALTPTAAAYRLVREANYYEAQLVLGATEAQALDATAGFVVAAAVRASGVSLDFGMRTRVGAAAFEEQDRSAFAPSGTLSAALGYTATTATVTSIVDGTLVSTGTYAQIDSEIVRVDAWDATTGALTLGRGVLGTVAAEHASGARIFFLERFFAGDNTERIDGEVVDVRLTPRTGAGELDESSAPTDIVTLDQSIARPYAPGQIRIDGAAYPAAAAAGFVISWKHRHRTQQNLEGDESGDIGPESGTTYTVEVRDAVSDSLLESTTGITGTSHAPSTLPAGSYSVRVRLWSVRSGLASAQRHDIVFGYASSGVRATEAAELRSTEADSVREQE